MSHHIIITGSGRSGSNRMLDVFDWHPWVHCRNEVDLVSPIFQALPEICIGAANYSKFLPHWKQAVASTTRHQSGWDRLKTTNKHYLNVLGKIWTRIIRHEKIRRLIFGTNTSEWALPTAFVRNQKKMIPAIKLLSRPMWVIASHAECPDQYVVHIIRDPKGYMNSWWNRFVLSQPDGVEATYQRVKKHADPILTLFSKPELAPRYSQAEMLRGEIWIWRHNNDLLHCNLRNSERYGVFDYDRLSTEPRSEMQRAMQLANLSDAYHRDADDVPANKLFTSKHKTELDIKLLEAVLESELSDSPCGQLYRPSDVPTSQTDHIYQRMMT